jgi:hypothetical protein
MQASVALVFFGLVLVIHQEGQAIYRCYDKEGRQVLTDQPAQLEQCIPLDVVTPPMSDSRKFPVVPIPAVPSPIEGRRASPEEQGTDPVNPTVAVPLQQVGHLFVVTVKLNGAQDARLIVDTGASHSIVSHKLAIELGLYSDSTMGTAHDEYCGGIGSGPLGSNQVDSLGGGRS